MILPWFFEKWFCFKILCLPTSRKFVSSFVYRSISGPNRFLPPGKAYRYQLPFLRCRSFRLSYLYRLLKNAHLLRFPHPSSLRRTPGTSHFSVFRGPCIWAFLSSLENHLFEPVAYLHHGTTPFLDLPGDDNGMRPKISLLNREPVLPFFPDQRGRA